MTRQSDLQAVIRSGCRYRTPRIHISWRPNKLGHPRLGIVVPRYGKRAIDRNRVRRRVREISRRRILPSVHGIDLVVRSRPEAYNATFGELMVDLDRWLDALPT